MSTNALRVQRIEAKAFKAFRNLDFRLDGRNLLAYGGNGAGKSSFYWLLYTFLQSAAKQTDAACKYFDKNRPEHLLNVHSDEAEQEQAHISVTLDSPDHSSSQRFALSANQHGTQQVPDLVKSNLASDFITYRILFNFYRFRNSEAIDLWQVFETEIIPFCYTTTERDLHGLWQDLKNNDPYQSGLPGPAKKRYDAFDEKATRLNTALNQILDSITKEAQKFYQQHFSEDDLKPIEFGVVLRHPTSPYDRKKHRFDAPVIGFEVKIDGKKLERPHTFLNEATLTQLALSIRFGATLSHLQDAPLKLLVLDDLLISLDMSNRMKVVDIILSETFANYQKIILTHDLGFFNEFRRRIGSNHTDWSFQSFTGKADAEIKLQEKKEPLQQAEDYIRGFNLDEAVICLRKAAEDTAKRYREWAEGKALPPGKFFSLTDNLRAARNKLLEGIPAILYKKVLKGTPTELRTYLLSSDDTDLDNNGALQTADKVMLKSKRKGLRDVLNHDVWKKMEAVESVDRVLEMTERVLNPASHGITTPLYEEEVRRAKRLIERLEQVLRS